MVSARPQTHCVFFSLVVMPGPPTDKRAPMNFTAVIEGAIEQLLFAGCMQDYFGAFTEERPFSSQSVTQKRSLIQTLMLMSYRDLVWHKFLWDIHPKRCCVVVPWQSEPTSFQAVCTATTL